MSGREEITIVTEFDIIKNKNLYNQKSKTYHCHTSDNNSFKQ